ncbi:hypothetical protein Glove_104g21 [Diversispora epigaea]|uniref:Glutathione peroxidase n=1 Tax=Diversispora epigaea TaxID=1348612 RepID=A0A397JDI5_9GLOM|nr:hypothetical protein Glove_104g21 [Diversispora epigaea]
MYKKYYSSLLALYNSNRIFFSQSTIPFNSPQKTKLFDTKKFSYSVMATSKSFYDFEEKNIKGIPVKFSEYKGKVVLVVNVASNCGFTQQYTPLQELYEKYNSEGFEILGFPCNEFGNQEPGSNEEIDASACSTYKVTFPLFQKTNVKGSDASPIYQFLKSHNPGEIQWNFEKFVIDRKGNVRGRYKSKDVPGIKDASTLLFDVIKESA